MAIEHVPDMTLQEQMAALQAQDGADMPPEVLASMQQDLDTLVRSGIAQHSLQAVRIVEYLLAAIAHLPPWLRS